MRARSLLRSLVGVGVAAAMAAALGIAPAQAAAGKGSSPRNSAAAALSPRPGIHLMPTNKVARSMSAKVAAAPVNLAYWGGPVMQAGTRTIPVFWEPPLLQDGTSGAVDPDYNSLIQRFFEDIGGHGLYNNVTQYYQVVAGPHTKYIVNSSGFMQAIVDTAPYPSSTGDCAANVVVNCITDAQLQAELTNVIHAGSLPTGYSTAYMVLTDSNESSCAEPTACFNPENLNNFAYCAYHGSFLLDGQAGKPVMYANMPYMDSNIFSIFLCGGGTVDANANEPFDDETWPLSHEFMEMITDPNAIGDGWYDLNYGEIGDICGGEVALVTWGTHNYAVQTEYSNAVSACVPGGNNQITLSVTSGSAGASTIVNGTGFTPNHSVTLSFSDAAGIVTSVAPTTSNGSGAITQSVNIPGGAANGVGTLDATGATPGDGASASFTVSGSPTTFVLTISKTGTGTGAVSSSPAGITCGATCQSSFSSGTPVTLTATPDISSTFTGWSGSGCSGTSNCQVTMSAAHSVTATFTLKTFSLTVSKSGTGTGAVTSSPVGISCGAACQTSFNYNTSVTLTATPDVSSTFTGWSGDCSGTGTCTVTMAAAHSVGASFTPSSQTSFGLTVSKAGGGAGGVTSSPSGIDCGATCQFSFASGTPVTLTATPDAFSTFAGWSGAGCAGTGTCQVTMNQAQSATATFAAGYLPDAQISHSGGAYVGNNIYNTTGASQSRAASSHRGTTATFHWKVQNDGTLTDRVVFVAPGNSTGFTVSFFLGTANVTKAVVAGTYAKNLVPGKSLVITVKIAVSTNATVGAVKSELLSATSLNQPKTDVVLAKVTAK